MIITEILECKSNKDRINIYADGSFAFACYLETALKHGIKKGVELTEEQAERIRAEDGRRYALFCALRFVERKLRSTKEVEDKLRGLELSEEAVCYAVEKLREYGYLDDENYARLYGQELLLKYGPKVVVYRLLGKGIDRETANSIVEEYQERSVLSEQVARLSQRYAGEEQQKRNQKIIRALLAKGFLYEEIKGELKEFYEE